MTRAQRPTAIVTGCGAMGVACAEALAPEHRLVVVDRSEELVAAATSRLAEAGAEVEGVTCDVLDRAALAAVAAGVPDGAPLGALVHTAGTITGSAREIFDINFVGTANVLDAIWPLVGEGTAGVCIASIGGHKPVVLAYDDVVLGTAPREVWDRLDAATTIAENPYAGYSMSKRGVILLGQSYARRWGERGARLVTISPGVIATEMARAAQGRAGSAIVDAATPRRAGEPSEIAAAVAFLCSPAAAYIHGCDLRVDGGAVANILTNPELRASLEAWDGASAFVPRSGS